MLVFTCLFGVVLYHHEWTQGTSELSVNSAKLSNGHTKKFDPTEQFVGRDMDIRQILLFFYTSAFTGIRVLGLWGAPAVGKSAMAYHTGKVMAEREFDVWYSNLNDFHWSWKRHNCSTNVSSCIDRGERQLSIPLYSLRTQVHKTPQLHGWAKRIKNNTLLILDNCDQLLIKESEEHEFTRAINTLVELSPSLHVIVTSRQRIPDFVDFKHNDYEIQTLDDNTALELLHMKTVKKIRYHEGREVIRLVGGNPLAIQLVARLLDNTYSLQGLITSLKWRPIETLSDVHVLSADQRLDHVLELSYNLLDNETRACGWYLSLFPGSFTESAAVDILKDSGLHNCLSSLVSKAFLQLYYSRFGYSRYHFHNLIKQFFQYKLHKSVELYDTVMKFNCSFMVVFSNALFTITSMPDPNEEQRCAFKEDSHNYVKILDMLAIIPPISTDSVIRVAYSIIAGQNLREVFRRTHVFSVLQATTHAMTTHDEQIRTIIGEDRFIDLSVAICLAKLAVSADSATRCGHLCETVSTVLYSTATLDSRMFRQHYGYRVIQVCLSWTCWITFEIVCSCRILLQLLILVIILSKLAVQEGSIMKLLERIWTVVWRSFVVVMLLVAVCGHKVVSMALLLNVAEMHVWMIRLNSCTDLTVIPCAVFSPMIAIHVMRHFLPPVDVGSLASMSSFQLLYLLVFLMIPIFFFLVDLVFVIILVCEYHRWSTRYAFHQHRVIVRFISIIGFLLQE